MTYKYGDAGALVYSRRTNRKILFPLSSREELERAYMMEAMGPPVSFNRVHSIKTMLNAIKEYVVR